ncbi:MAG: hypothetical protein K6F33_01230 [Bacteroidales bacterium]|nr:hypothetical protein [Bacteroidales bacterium]
MKKSFVLLIMMIVMASCGGSEVTSFEDKDAMPAIYPDYTEVTIPVNIAPLNFKASDGNLQMVEVSSAKGSEKIVCSDGQLIWDIDDWKMLLKDNVGGSISITAYIADRDGRCYRYKPFRQYISPDSIDSHIAYRNIETGYVLWLKMGLYQRCIENFDSKPIIENTGIDNACVNCHTFCKQQPDKMMFHIRKFNPGTAILWEGKLQKYNTKIDSAISGGVYSSWNPNGYVIAMSTNDIGQRFHNDLEKRIYVSDRCSDIVVMNMKTETVSSTPKLCTEDLENFPAWSPDGKTMYYISAKKRREGDETDTSLRYSMLKIGYDAESDTWGDVDTMLTDRAVHGSVAYPKASPCGRYIAYTVAKRGYFTPFDQETEIWLLDLQTMQTSHPQGVNSTSTESNHNWSHNGKWLVVGSKYPDKLFTKPYMAHFNPENGTFDKRFVLPQEDPDFYERFTANFNNTDFIAGEVPVSEFEIRDAVRGEAKKVKSKN